MVDPSPDDLDAWVDHVAESCDRLTGIDAFEVRGEVREDRRAQFDADSFRGERRFRLAGVSVRVWVHSTAAYAFCTDPEPGEVREMLDRARRLAQANARRGATGFPPRLRETRVRRAVGLRRPPEDASPGEIQELLERARSAALDAAPGHRGTASLGFGRRRLVRADSAGSWAESETAHSSLFTQVVVREDGRLGEYVELVGGERGLADYAGFDAPEAVGARAAQYALENARAEPAPAGRFRVLTDPHLSGLLAHESFGHLTEYDLVAPGWSLLKDRRGGMFADEAVSIVDAPESPDGRPVGVRVPVDDEGTEGRPVRLLDRGRLNAYLHSRDSAFDAQGLPTGNARALDVRYAPIVRQRNTYFEPGDLDLEEALTLLGDGLYLCGGRGGAPHSDGSFLFTSQRGYRVQGGRIIAPIQGPSLSGNVFDFLHRVEGLTRDFDLFTNYFGGCGKWDQSFLHVGHGGPHILVGDALVGGEHA